MNVNPVVTQPWRISLFAFTFFAGGAVVGPFAALAGHRASFLFQTAVASASGTVFMALAMFGPPTIRWLCRTHRRFQAIGVTVFGVITILSFRTGLKYELWSWLSWLWCAVCGPPLFALEQPEAGAKLGPQLVTPPGSRIRSLLQFIYSKRSMALVFDPLLADVQSEWLEATIANHCWHARWITVRCYGYIVCHIICKELVELMQMFCRVWKP
jgi:hypothetical protein